MGGNALDMPVVRLEKKYYDYLAEGQETILKETFPNAKIKVIPAYAEKESFGDIDVLISGVPMDALRMFCETKLQTPEMHQNGNVLSFAFEITALVMKRAFFQVDYITVPAEDFDFALNYFAYNDLGNLIGQTAHGIGLKFGHDGLWYKYIVETQLVKEICITKDFAVALDILGYSVHSFNVGFRTLGDIFHYAASSPYFTTWNYQLENRNAVGRVRDKKRKTYMAFLEWLKDKKLSNVRLSKDLGIRIATEREPEIAREFILATLNYFKVDRVKKKVNGENIRVWTGLEGKNLGEFMSDFRGEDRDAFLNYIDLLPTDKVEGEVKAFFETWSNK